MPSLKSSYSVHFAARFLMAMASLGALAAPATSEAKPVGALETLATVPATPGFPEGIAVSGSHVYVSSPARFGTAGTAPGPFSVAHSMDFRHKRSGVNQLPDVAAGPHLG